MPEDSTHKCTNAVNNLQPIRNSSHMAKILSVYNRLQAGGYENGNGGKRRVSRLTQFIHAMLELKHARPNWFHVTPVTTVVMLPTGGIQSQFHKPQADCQAHLLVSLTLTYLHNETMSMYGVKF